MVHSPSSKKSGPWYREGLQFECTQCGNCCTGAPGYVFLSEEEIVRIAEFLGREDKWLGKEHLRKINRTRYSLTEDRATGDCCFLKTTPEGKRICSIYPVRPLQCRTWPFWDINLESQEAWAETAEGCPGMNKGKRYDLVQIEVRLHAERIEDLPK